MTDIEKQALVEVGQCGCYEKKMRAEKASSMTSELRPASEVWSIACGAYEDAAAEVGDLPMRDMVIEGDKAAAAVIEADREAVRAEQAAELAKWKALAEMLANRLKWIESDPGGYNFEAIRGCAADAVRQYEEAIRDQ